MNIGSIDQSVQNFGTENDTQEILRRLEQIADAIKQLKLPEAERKDALLDVEQVKLELQRSKPEASRVWTLVERLKGIAELGEQLAKLAPLLQPLLERLPG